jgi:hypothetical protein
MNLINAICCVLLARTSELGQNYLANNQGMLRRRLATATDANRFIDSAIQELTLSGSDLCKCTEQTVAQTPMPDSDDIPDATGRRRTLLERIKKRMP